MATKKNPLSALLNTDERKQAQEFTRDHVLRSATRQAGTYGVDVRGTLPVSQTSLGRLSASLGTMSGILNQFNEYQTQKEQAELRKEGLQQQIKLEGIRGEQLDETVKQQNIRIGELNQRRADSEFDRMFASLTPEQRQAELEKTKETLERAKRERTEAEIELERQNPDDYTKSPFYTIRAQRIQGAALSEDYAVFYEEREKELLANLPNMEDGFSLTPERAEELSEQILDEYLEANGLDTNTELGKGFLEATSRYNAAKIPTLASQLKSRSEGLSLQNSTTAATNFARNIGIAVVDANGEPLDAEASDISNQDWFKQLSAMPQEKQLAFLMGTKGNASLGIRATQGVFGNMSRTAKGALQFQRMLNDDLADKLIVNGKPFKEFGQFESIQAEVEEAVDRLTEKEAQQEVNDFAIAAKQSKDYLEQIGATMSPNALEDIRLGLIQPDDTSEEVRERLVELFPPLEEQIKSIPEGRVFEYASYLSSNLATIQVNSSKITDRLISENAASFTPYNTQSGLYAALTKVKKLSDVSDPKNLGVNSVLQGYMSGVNVTGGLGLDNRYGGAVVTEFDKDSGGLVTEYTQNLNNLAREVREDLGADVTSEDFGVTYRERLNVLNKQFEEDVMNFLRGSVRERNMFKAALSRQDDAYFAGREGLEDTLLFDDKFINNILSKDITIKPEEAVKLAEEYNKSSSKTPEDFLNAYKASDASRAGSVEAARASTKTLNSKTVEAYTKPGGKHYKELSSLTRLLQEGGVRAGIGGPLERYNQLIDSTEAAIEKDFSLSVSLDQVSDIAFSALLLTKGSIPVVLGDSWKPTGKPLTTRMSGAYGVQTGYSYEGRETPISATWPTVRRDASIRRDFFSTQKPPVEGIQFGAKPPKESDINGILEKSGLSRQSFRNIQKLYGYNSGIEFLKDQYNNSYYTNKRTLNK